MCALVDLDVHVNSVGLWKDDRNERPLFINAALAAETPNDDADVRLDENTLSLLLSFLGYFAVGALSAGVLLTAVSFLGGPPTWSRRSHEDRSVYATVDLPTVVTDPDAAATAGGDPDFRGTLAAPRGLRLMPR